MTKSDELLGDVKRKTRRFRISQIALLAVIAAALIFLGFVGYNQTSSNKQLLQAQSNELAALNSNAKTRSKQINDLQKHIDCIGYLLEQSNRSNLSIADLQNCALKITSTGEIVSTTPPISSSTPANTNSQQGSVAPTTNNAPVATTAPTTQNCTISVLFLHIDCKEQ